MPPLDLSRLRRQQMPTPMQFPMGEEINYAAQPPVIPIEPGISYPTDVTGPFQNQEPEINAAQMMRDLYQPRYEMQDRFAQEMDSFPQRTQPGNLRKIGASLIGLRNVGKKNQSAQDAQFTTQLQDRFMDKPFHQGREDWAAKIDPLGKAAENERMGNVNERNIASTVVNQTLAERRTRETERKNRASEENARARIRVSQWKAEHPDWDIKIQGDRVVGYNPKNPKENMDLGASGGMDMRDLEILRGGYRVRAAEATQNAAGERQTARAWGDPYEVTREDGTKGWYQTNSETGEVRATQFPDAAGVRRIPSGSSANPNPNQEQLGLARTRFNEAQRILATDPEARKWIKIGRDGTVTIAPAMTAAGRAKRKQYSDAIFPENRPPARSQSVGPNTGQNPGGGRGNVPPNQQTGDRVRVMDANGNVGTVPRSQLQQAIQQGYKEVQ